MRVLVTGAAGFVGANLCRAARDAGHEVHAVVRPGSDRWRLAEDGWTLHSVDIADRSAIMRQLDAIQPAAIFSAAAHGAYPQQLDTARMLSVNIGAVECLVQWAAAHDALLLHLGSSSEYGEQPVAPSESARLAPNSMYAITKAAGSHVVCDAVARHALRAVVLRLYSVYGQWEDPHRLMPTVAACALRGELPATLVDPAVARDFVHVDDVVRAVMRWIGEPTVVPAPAIINIGSGKQSTIADVIELARATCSIVAQPQWGTMPNRSWDTTAWVSDISRAEHYLSWVPTIELADGFRHLLQFIATVPNRYLSGPAQ